MPSLARPHISMISVISILDIVLVAILIYQFLVLVRGTRAAPMLVGVATLGLAFYFARLGDLRRNRNVLDPVRGAADGVRAGTRQ